MNLGELKTLVYKLLDESRPKTDLTEKIPVFVDAGQKEVSIYAPIWRQEQYEADGELPMDCRRPDRVVDESGTPLAWHVVQGMDTKTLAAERYPCILVYEAIPADVTDKTPDGKELEIGEQAALAVVLYVAAQCNSLEYDQRFFQSFYAQYQGKLANLAGAPDGPTMTAVADSELPDWM